VAYTCFTLSDLLQYLYTDRMAQYFENITDFV